MSGLRELVRDMRRILGRTGPASKFITYFELLDAFKNPGCPVCARLEAGAVKALDSLMYEQVNDPFTRQRLVESHGFCNWHAWILPGIHNSPLGVALIYRHLLQETLERLEATRRDVQPRGRWERLWKRLTGSREEPLPMLAERRKKARCLLCGFARRAEQDDLKTLLDFLQEPDFAEAFRRSAGLCLPHLYAAMAVGRDHPNLGPLLAIHEARWKDLIWELEEFARKFDYRYANEPRGRETSSWHRVLDVFVGRPAIFGPERGTEPVEPAPELQSTALTVGEPSESVETERFSEIETLRFENQKLHRRIQELLTQQAQERETRLALEFQVLKLTADLKAMAADLAAATQREQAGDEASTFRTDSEGQPPPKGVTAPQ